MKVSQRSNALLMLVPAAILIYFWHNNTSEPPKKENDRILKENEYKGLDQEDASLIAYVRTLFHPPSEKPYNLASPNKKHFTMMDQSKFVGDLFGPGKRKGFFVEAGGYDGEGSSSSLYLERELGFEGVLVEPNPLNFKKLISKQRKAYALNAALSPTKKAEELFFHYTGVNQQGSLVDDESKSKTLVKGIPLYTVLRALDVTFVDVINLDIQGPELKVLKTFPFNKIGVGIFIVEHTEVPEGKKQLAKFLEDQGYVKIHEHALDYIYAKPDYLKTLPGWKS